MPDAPDRTGPILVGPNAPPPKVAALVAALERRIAQGIWPAGHRLPPERVLAEEEGVARNTLRAALDRLERDLRIIRHVGRGTFVAEVPAQDVLAGLVDRMVAVGPADVMEARLIIEPQAVFLAATRASLQDLQAIEAAHHGCVKAGSIAEFEHWDGALHRAILEAARNALLMAFGDAIGAIRLQPRWGALKQQVLTQEVRRQYQGEHRRIVEALLDRNAHEAQRALVAHLESVRGHLGVSR